MRFTLLIIFSCLLCGSTQNKIKANNPQLATKTSIEIGFYRNIKSPDLQIKSLTAVLDNDIVVFTLTYRTKKDRFLSFFNPPQGNVLMYMDRDGLKKNDSTVTFRIARNEFQTIANISMRFSTLTQSGRDRNFIFLKLSDARVKKILGIKYKQSFLSRILPVYSSLTGIIALWLLVPLIIIIGSKTNSYTLFIRRWIKNKWVLFNVNVLLLSIVLVFTILLVFGLLQKSLPANVYICLLIIPILPSNMVYFIENTFFKSKKMFWGRQYLNLLSIIIGTFIMYKVCNEITDRIIAQEIISIEYAILIGIFVGFIRLINNYIIYQKIASLKEKEFEILQLKELKVRSDLNALQSKINPHFLYNSLNSIAELCWKDAGKTERMALSLSKLFRYSINKEESDFNSLKNEIEIVTLYLNIEKERFGDKLNYSLDYSPDLENTIIPKFLLQPLIENAIKHGIAKMPNGGKIKLTIQKMENQLEIKMYDNGPDFPVNLISGYGLKSIYDKLDLLYPKRYAIELCNGPEKNITILLKDDI